MRWSRTFIPTLREDPADAEFPSHQLLIRGGFIRQVAAGIYSYLPLGQRTMLKIAGIIREELNAAAAQEFFLPALHPATLLSGVYKPESLGNFTWILVYLCARSLDTSLAAVLSATAYHHLSERPEAA